MNEIIVRNDVKDREPMDFKRSTYFSHVRDPERITLRELRVYCNVLKIPAESLISAVYEGGD